MIYLIPSALDAADSLIEVDVLTLTFLRKGEVDSWRLNFHD